MKHTLIEYLEIFYNSPFFTGAAGAFTAMLFPSENVSRSQKIAYVIIGMMTAGFFSPVLIYYFNIENRNIENAIVFATGLSGMYLAGGLLKVGKEFKEDPSAAIKKFNPWRKK